MVLLKATPEDVSAPFVYRVSFQSGTQYEGPLYVIDLFGEEKFGKSEILITEDGTVDIAEIEHKVKSYKENMDEMNKMFYGGSLKMREEITQNIKTGF
jgi:hypothetical protein